MNRRDFLGRIGAGLAAAAAVTAIPAVAGTVLAPTAVSNPAAIVEDTRNKFQIALDLLDEAVVIQKTSIRNKAGLLVGSDALHAKIDEMLRHIRENFVLPTESTYQSTIEVVSKILPKETDFKRRDLEGYPPKIIEQAWPVGVMVTALREYELQFDNRKSVEFSWFHTTYGPIINFDID